MAGWWGPRMSRPQPIRHPVPCRLVYHDTFALRTLLYPSPHPRIYFPYSFYLHLAFHVSRQAMSPHAVFSFSFRFFSFSMHRSRIFAFTLVLVAVLAKFPHKPYAYVIVSVSYWAAHSPLLPPPCLSLNTHSISTLPFHFIRILPPPYHHRPSHRRGESALG